MSLTLALSLIAALVLLTLGVQAYLAARRAEPRQPEPVADGTRMEPSLHGLPTAVEPSLGAGDFGISLDPHDLPNGLEPGMAAAAVRRLVPRLDPLIDAIVPLTLDQPIAGDVALQHLPASRRAGTKPYLVEGCNADTGDWEPLQHGHRYSELQAGIQLANRNGPLNDIEYSEFVQTIETYADALGAMADVPDMLEAVGRAREIDAFASQHDAQLTTTLRTNGVAWSVGYIQQGAARHGFVPGALPGRLVMPSPDAGAPPLLVLVFDAQAALSDDPNHAAVRYAALSLDVPQTAQANDPYSTWQDAAHALAKELDATLIDDQTQPITPEAFQTIGVELDKLYAELEAHGLMAGSPSARRLFS